MSTDSLIATVKRHVVLLREDPEFVNYVVNLALYLLEINGGTPPDQLPEPRQGDPARLTTTAVEKLEAAAPANATDICRMCGAPTEGKHICPACGHMAG